MSVNNNSFTLSSGCSGYFDERLVEKLRARQQAASNVAVDNSLQKYDLTSNVTNQSPDIVELSEHYQRTRNFVAGQAEDGSDIILSWNVRPFSQRAPVAKEESEVFKFYDPVSHAEEMRLRFAGIDRALGLEPGTSFDKHYGDMIRGNAEIDWDKQEALWKKTYIDDYYAHEEDFAETQKQINSDRSDINAELSDLLSEAGLNEQQQKSMLLTLNADGSFSVDGLDGDTTKMVEDLLSSNSHLTQRMLKASAMQSSIDLDYIKETEESLAIEMTLVDIYLKEKVGYGIDDLDIFRLHSDKTDPALRELFDNDQLLERQIYRYGERKYHGFENSFSATWSIK